MASYVSCCILFRIVLPVIILTCVFFRPCVLSGIYLILLLLSSCFPVPSQYSMSGSTGVYLKLLIMISTFASFGQLIFQALMLLHWTPYGSILPKCEFIERLLRHCGFVRLDKLDVLSILVWVTPEAIMFITSIVFYILFSKLSKGPRGSMIEAAPAFAQSYHDIAINKQRMKLLTTLGKYLSVVALCLVAIMKPTVPGGFYFLLFLSTGTWWGCYKDLGRGYAYVLRFAMIVVFFHIFTFYAYQTDWPQDYLLPNSTYSRYFGFTILLETKCVEPRHFIFYDSPWLDYALLPSLIILFFILAISSKQLLEPQGILAKDLRPSETTPLIQSVASTRYGIHQKGPAILQDSTGSVIVAAERTDDIALKEVTEDVLEHDKPTCFDQFIYVLESIFLFIIRTSYIGTNIIMMTWSITYHSWLTFVLLLWASLLWMVPNQRKFMLRSSPFLVFYAWFLIISSYIYSMDLTEEELPTKIDGIDLSQLGFIKVHDLPGKRLLVKSLYILAFWITLRQYMKERKEERQNVAMADMAAPLQISVGAAAGMSKKTKSNEVLQNVGSFIRRLLTKFWIWIVAITLFIVAITGQRMTSFRIMYMTLFVVFILSFQFSFRAWRKIMFAFWLTVIIFSMLILVIVYTYQFDNFPEYWTTYLHISPRMQADIGLEKYQTKQLFMKLATQTFFVIIAVVQLHYFHKDFLEMSKPNQGGITDTTKSEANSSAQGGAKLEESNLDEPDEDVSTIDLTDIDNVSSKVVKKKFRKILHYLYNVLNLVMLFLEIHMPKIIMFMVMVVCVMDVAAIYIILVIPLVLAATIGKGMVKFALNFSSFIAGLLLLLRMVYQIEYISHDMWNVNCTENSTTSNSAEWLGFYKISDGRNLPELVKWNIILVLSVTILCIVNLRQSFFRAARGEPTSRPFFMFPKAKVTNASNGLINYFQYLANYFYYRMGVEMCLIGMVATIGIRMDLYAMIYAFWLAAFFMMDRKLLARFWNVFLVYIAFVIPVQYIMVVGLPPNLCIEYPWDDNDILRNLQEWAFLMDDKLPPPPKKILCDFILLLLVARQSLVFRIEKRFEGGQDYPGGSNESVIHMAESRGFENPIPDYITYSRNYLDIMKKALFMPFMWVTLAIVFLAGTNRVNLFSVGYLLGSFYFLWEGSDIYLMPIPKILKRWNYLIGFNVFVIGMKVALQLVGCLFFDYIKNDVCWLIQLLGISCLRKFKTAQFVSSLSTDECNVGRENVGLAWDGACFAFLILMRRLFNSYHFFHIINESKASAILASRGADLIEELRQKRMVEQDEEERKIIEKIKTKMDRIKANQQKILGPNYQEPENHFIDTVYPKSNRPMYRRKEPKHYKAAIRSGDYYMFDDMDQEEIDVFDVKSRTDEEAEYRRRHNQRTLSELLSSTMKTDVGTVVRSTAGRRRVSLPTQPKVHMAGSQISTHFSAPPVVRIQDEKDDETDEPRPGTSREEEPEETIKPISRRQKIMDCILFLFAFIDSFMLSLTNYINKFSKDHRYVIRVLSKEKKILKETTDYNVGIRSGPNSMWQPSGSYRSLLMHSRGQQVNFMDDYEQGEMSSYDQPTVLRLLLAVWYLILSHSDMVCYFMIFLNQTRNATFISLPLPLMVFLWGTLTVPRPSKTFWITIIAYTQVIVLIKCMFQFQILPWNRDDFNYSYQATRIIGVERKTNYAVWDLILLLVVYFHRFMLKCLGLWKVSYQPHSVLADGEYNIENGELKPMEPERQSRHEDLEQLVDESDAEDRVYVHATQIDPREMLPGSIKMTFQKYVEGLRGFFKQLFDPTSRVAADVYSYMFLCDFFNFFVILVGYSSFGSQQGDGGVSSYLQDNRVPVLFLVMLILQFLIIIVDRGIFLRKNIFAKIVFQFIQIFILHIWLFIIYPIMTERSVNQVLPPQMYYMVKCFYLLLSAYQIRCGYPTRILGNFLCKGYNYFYMILFKCFMLVPFLFELRTVMDWMWTDTSMTVFDWIKMEDIFTHIYQLKCARHIEAEYPQPRGERKKAFAKYSLGGLLLAIIIGIIWFPLVFFSLGNAVGEPNPPYDVQLDLRVGPYSPLYRMTAQSNSIYQFNENDFLVLQQRYLPNKIATTFLSAYDAADIAAVRLSTDSANVWSISPPDRARMVAEVNSSQAITIQLEYQIKHKTNTKEDSGLMRNEVVLKLEPFVNNQTNPIRTKLLEMLQKKPNDPPLAPLFLEYIMPKFVKATSRGTTQIITQLMEPIPDAKATSLRNLSLNIAHDNGQVWWTIKEEDLDHNYIAFLSHLPYNFKDSIILYTFNDKIFPQTLSLITGGGIIGLYSTLVFVASRLLRGFFSEICFKIMFDDMPYVDRVLQLCLDIYLVREAGEFCLEEDLFAKLVFLYRSPETLIKWTRPIEEVDDEDNPEGDNN